MMNPITKFRKDFGYSQVQLAEMLNVSQSAVSQWEQGKTLPDILTAQKLALIFGVTMEDLLEASDYAPLLRSNTKLQHNYDILNEEGRRKLLEYSEDLISTGKYNNPSSSPENGGGIDGQH